MSNVKITIPKMTGYYKLYVYCSKNPKEIDTLVKIKSLKPNFIIDESKAEIFHIDGKECYVVYDEPFVPQTGVEFLGPKVDIIPVTEYETSVNVIKINDFTYVNELELTELPLRYTGVMVYYSVLGVDETENMITHLSKVAGVMAESDYKKTGTRHIYSCEDYKNKDDDKWTFVAAVPWEQDIKIGNITDASSLSRFGIPVVEEVPTFEEDSVKVATRSINHGNHAVIEIPNPWQKDNYIYNYRRLKSYKVQNVDDDCYSNFSEPTYQSLLPVPLERMVIIRKDTPDNPDEIISLADANTGGYDTWQVIRKDGTFYKATEHRKYGLNKYNIPLREKIAVFSESSVQDYIKIQIETLPVHVYSYTIYLQDIYGLVSEPYHFVLRT